MNILITGATRGIGYHIAMSFIKKGHKVFGVGRNWDNFYKAEKNFNNMFIPIKADIENFHERIKIFSWLKEQNIKIDVLVNNAGIGSLGRFQNISWEESSEVINLNITALTHMTELFLKNLENKNISEGTGIINVSSTAAFQSGGPYAAVYYACKAYVKSFTAALYEELHSQNIKVMCLCPGPVKTDFKGMKYAKKSFYIMTPEKTAEIAVEDYFKNKDISVPGFINKFLTFTSKFIPRKKELKIIKKIQKKKI